MSVSYGDQDKAAYATVSDIYDSYEALKRRSVRGNCLPVILDVPLTLLYVTQFQPFTYNLFGKQMIDVF